MPVRRLAVSFGLLAASATAIAQESPIEGLLQDLTTSESARETARVIEIVCPSGSAAGTQFQEDCNAVVGAALEQDPAAQDEAAEALVQVTTDQAAGSLDSSQVRARSQNDNIGSRVAALRGGAVGLSTRGLTLNVDGEAVPVGDMADAYLRELQGANGGAAGADSALDFGRLGVFINGSVGSGDRDGTSREAGYDIDAWSVTLGADYRLRDNLIAGAAVGYTSSETDLDGNGGSLDADGYNFSLYGTWFEESGLYVDGIVSFGSSDYDQERKIRYSIGSTVVEQTARADFDGSEWSASVGGGYQMYSGPWSYGPTVRLEYISTDVDGYDEKASAPGAAGGGWTTRIEDQDLDSFTSRIGGEVAYAWSTSWGVLLPSAQLEWVHEFEDNAGDVVGYYLQDTSQTAFSLKTDDLDQNYFDLTLGLSAQFAEGRTGYVSFRKLFGYDDFDAYTVHAGLRLAF
jgi:outer membrane autotransporter protein